MTFWLAMALSVSVALNAGLGTYIALDLRQKRRHGEAIKGFFDALTRDLDVQKNAIEQRRGKTFREAGADFAEQRAKRQAGDG